MTYSAFDQTKEQIMNDVLYILDFIRKDRSFLNKHFQNSINNYFLEDYAGNFLKEYLNMPRAKDITKFVQNKYMDLKGTKYMKLMYGYIQELKESNQITQFKNLLISNMQSESYDNDKQSKEWQSNVWKKAFSLFVLHFCQLDNDSLKGIFEIWNSLFPRSKILRKRQENVNHRPREFQEQEINNVRSSPKQTTSNNFLSTSEQDAIQNINNTFFGNDFKQGVFYPEKNQYHLKQQMTYYVAPQQQLKQEPVEQINSFYSNQAFSQSKLSNNQVFEEIAEPEINFDLPQQSENIFDFFVNVPEDFSNSSNSSSPISSAAQTMVQYEQQPEQFVEQQPNLNRMSSYQYLQQQNQSNQFMNQCENNQFLFQENENNDDYYHNQEYNFLEMSQNYMFVQQGALNQNNYA